MGFLSKIRRLFKADPPPATPDPYSGLPGYAKPYGYFGGAGYTKSGFGGAGSDGAKWTGGLSSTGASPILDHWYLRQNARSAYHDTPAAHGIVERFADTVIGKGLRLESTPDANILGIEPEAAEKWARDVEARFHSWARNKKSSKDESQNFYQMQRLAETQRQRDGEYFVRFYRSRRQDLLNPLQIQYIDPSQIRGAAFTNTYGYQVNDQDGIIRDASGKTVAYQISIYNKEKKSYIPTVVPAKGAKSGLTQMIHCFQREYAGQGRGYSKLSHAIQELENLTDFTSAHIKQAAIQSSIGLYVKPSKDAPASNVLDEITNAVAGPRTDNVAAVPGVPDDVEALTFHQMPEATLTTPGTMGIFNLQEGEDLGTVNSNAPMDSYKDFTEAFVSNLSASMSMPGEMLLMRFNNSYSASRALLVIYWRIVEIGRDEHAVDNLNPTYEAWMEGEIAAGRITAPGWSDPRLREAWLMNSWIGDPMPNIDPSKTSKASKDYIEMGATTIGRVSRELNGSDAKSNAATLTRELSELPKVPWSSAPTEAEPMEPDDDDKEDDDNKKKEDK